MSKRNAPAPTSKVAPSLHRLLESELDKAELVISARAIPDQLQKMAEALAKIEADDMMPMMDSLRDAVGPQVSEQFVANTIQQCRDLMNAALKAKSAVLTEIDRLEQAINGEPVSDMAMTDTPAEPGAPDAGAPAPGAPEGEPPASAPETPDAEDDELGAALDKLPPDATGAADGADSMAGNFAGRARKESRRVPSGRKLTDSRRAGYGARQKLLQQAGDPDRLVMHSFREHLARYRAGRRLTEQQQIRQALRDTAHAYAIDPADVAMVIRAAKARATRLAEFEMRPTPASKRGKYDGWTEEDLKSRRAAVKRDMRNTENSGKPVSHALKSELADLSFALRAKHNWGKVPEGALPEDTLLRPEDIAKYRQAGLRPPQAGALSNAPAPNGTQPGSGTATGPVGPNGPVGVNGAQPAGGPTTAGGVANPGQGVTPPPTPKPAYAPKGSNQVGMPADQGEGEPVPGKPGMVAQPALRR